MKTTSSIALLVSGLFVAGCNNDSSSNNQPPPPPSFTFADTLVADYTQVDRLGMPAVATAVITSKDAYNRATPVDDAAGNFVGEISANVDALHTALDDDLIGAGFDPATSMQSLDQAGPLIVPDVITLNTTQPSGFPNGRLLADPVIDVTLAVVLLDLSAMGQSATSFAALPLNPPANDVPFTGVFPYVNPPFTP